MFNLFEEKFKENSGKLKKKVRLFLAIYITIFLSRSNHFYVVLKYMTVFRRSISKSNIDPAI